MKQPEMGGIRIGDLVRFYPVAGRKIYEERIVTEVIPKGIPSCREPLLKLEGKAGVVLEAHCRLMKTTQTEKEKRDG